MPTYRYQCQFCGTIEIHSSIHDERLARCPEHDTNLVHIMTAPFIAAAATPTKSKEVNQINQTEAQWDVDMPAYARMRKDGIQPKGIDGAATIEAHADTQFEVESGNLYRKGAKQIQEGVELSKELGLTHGSKAT